MLGFIGDIFMGFLELIGDIFVTSVEKTDLDKNIEELNKQEWFNQLYNDYRYKHVIHHSWKVNRYLNKKENVQLLINSQEKRDDFIKWVKDEHQRITWGKKKVKE